jgi:hypothetical protein
MSYEQSERLPVAQRIADTLRPFRIWDSRAKKHVRWRNYSDAVRGHNAALVLISWEEPGAALELYDVRSGKLLGQYVRTPTSVKFIRG